MDVTSSAVGAMGSEDAVGDVDAARDALPGDIGWLPTSFRGELLCDWVRLTVTRSGERGEIGRSGFFARGRGGKTVPSLCAKAIEGSRL